MGGRLKDRVDSSGVAIGFGLEDGLAAIRAQAERRSADVCHVSRPHQGAGVQRNRWQLVSQAVRQGASLALAAISPASFAPLSGLTTYMWTEAS